MSEHSRVLESTRRCISDRKPNGAIIYIVVAIVAVIAGATSGHHESPLPPKAQPVTVLQ